MPLLKPLLLALCCAVALSVDITDLDACKATIDEFCGSKPNKYQCLSSGKVAVPDECMEELVQFTIETTLAAVTASCPDACDCPQDSTECVEKCIVDMLDPENPANKKNQPPKCRVALARYQLRSAENVRADIGMNLYCQTEKQMCGGKRGKQFRSCVEEAAANRSPSKCHEVVFARKEADAESIDFDPELKAACAAEMAQFCATADTAEAGAVKHCLFDKRKRTGFGADCRAMVEGEIKEEESDIRLDFRAFANCKADLKTFCSADSDKLSCMKKNIKKVNVKCRNQIKRIIKTQADDIRTDNTVLSACLEDIKTWCKDVPRENNKVQTCLREHLDELSFECVRAEFAEEKVEVQSIDLSGGRFAVCTDAVETLCKDIEPEEQAVTDCLIDKRGDEKMDAKCKKAVRLFMKEQGEDVRLYTQLAKHCDADLTSLCGPSSDYFSRRHYSAAAYSYDKTGDLPSRGWVLKCIVETSKDIKNPDCAHDVERLKAEHAEDYATDRVFAKACRANVKEFCSNVERGQGRVHACLREHYTSLSDACKMAEFEEEVVEVEDVALKPKIKKACKGAIQKFCGSVEGADVMSCLTDNQNSPDMPDECLTALTGKAIEIAEIEAAAPEEAQEDLFALRPALKRHCTASANKLCAGEKDKLDCLLGKMEEIEVNNCKKALIRVQATMETDIRTDVKEEHACGYEIETYCKDVKPGQGRVHECLRQHFDDPSFSDVCRVSETRSQELAAADVRLNPKLMAHCKAAMGTVCKDVEVGDANMLRCLQDHVTDDDLSPKCQTAIREQMIASAASMSTHYRLRRACANVKVAACKDKTGTERLDCFLENVRTITNARCKAEVERVGAQRSEDIEVDPEAVKKCKADILTYCKGIKGGRGKLHECLREHNKLGQLSPACKTEEEKVEELEATDINMNYPIKHACKSEVKLFCKDVEAGDARVLACLQDKMGDEQMSRRCSKQLTKFSALELMRPTLNHRLTENCASEVAKLCPNSRPNQYLSCLVSEFKKSSGSKCHVELLRTVRVQALNFESSNELLQEACKSDRAVFCAGVEDGAGRIHQCLRTHMSELTTSCREQETGLLQNEATDYRLNPQVQRACLEERRRLCSAESPGKSKVLSCLRAHTKDSDFDTACAAALQVFPGRTIPAYKPSTVSATATTTAEAGSGNGDSGSFIQLNGWVALLAVTALVGSVVVVGQRFWSNYQKTSKGYSVVINKD